MQLPGGKMEEFVLLRKRKTKNEKPLLRPRFNQMKKWLEAKRMTKLRSMHKLNQNTRNSFWLGLSKLLRNLMQNLINLAEQFLKSNSC
jgi:hypothetical protein